MRVWLLKTIMKITHLTKWWHNLLDGGNCEIHHENTMALVVYKITHLILQRFYDSTI